MITSISDIDQDIASNFTLLLNVGIQRSLIIDENNYDSIKKIHETASKTNLVSLNKNLDKDEQKKNLLAHRVLVEFPKIKPSSIIESAKIPDIHNIYDVLHTNRLPLGIKRNILSRFLNYTMDNATDFRLTIYATLLKIYGKNSSYWTRGSLDNEVSDVLNRIQMYIRGQLYHLDKIEEYDSRIQENNSKRSELDKYRHLNIQKKLKLKLEMKVIMFNQASHLSKIINAGTKNEENNNIFKQYPLFSTVTNNKDPNNNTLINNIVNNLQNPATILINLPRNSQPSIPGKIQQTPL